MISTLASAPVQRVLAELEATGVTEDARYRERLEAHGAPLYGRARAELGAAAPLAVSPAGGRLLYALVLARRPGLVVEFGASLGYSTVCLAAGLRDAGRGLLVSTELLAAKAERARHTLTAAGLDDLAEIRTGDALETLAHLPAPIDLLFLDGSNDLYLPLLERLGPRLAPGALVAADMSVGDPHHDRYRAHVGARFPSTEIAGVVISATAGAATG